MEVKAMKEKDDFFEWLLEEIEDLIFEEYRNGVPIDEIASDWETDRQTIEAIILRKSGGKLPPQ